MKTAYILFCKQKPKNKKTTVELITCFCREHDLEYKLRPDCKTITIDGNEYQIKLQEKHEASEPTYWMIYCSLKNRMHHLNNAAAV